MRSVVSFTPPLERFFRQSGLEKQVKFAASLALNDIAKQSVAGVRGEMQDVFDRPTRWTLNAFHFTRATKTRLVATIKRKDAVAGRHYLEVQQSGGLRPHTGLERQLATKLPYGGQVGYVVPTEKMRRDRHGNIHRGELQKILSDIGSQTLSSANSTKATRSKRYKKTGASYFVPRPGSGLKPGVYRRTSKGIARVLAFDAPRPGYRRRFRFEETVTGVARREIDGAFERALNRALATAR